MVALLLLQLLLLLRLYLRWSLEGALAGRSAAAALAGPALPSHCCGDAALWPPLRLPPADFGRPP